MPNLSAKEFKYFKEVVEPQAQVSENQIWVEGEKNVQDLIQNGLKIEKLFVTQKFAQLKWLRDLKVHLTILDNHFLENLSHLKTSPGIIAITQKPIVSFDFQKQDGLILALEGVQDPGNVGTIIRTADWFGIKDIILDQKCADPYSFKSMRAGMGSQFHLNLAQVDDLSKKLSELKVLGFQIVVTDLKGQEVAPPKTLKTCLVLGSEGQGISESTRSQADYAWRLKGYGKAESLNVSVSSAIFIYSLIN